jgi:hypothetical protein
MLITNLENNPAVLDRDQFLIAKKISDTKMEALESHPSIFVASRFLDMANRHEIRNGRPPLYQVVKNPLYKGDKHEIL